MPPSCSPSPQTTVNLGKMRSCLIPVLVVHEDAEIDDETLAIVHSELLGMERLGYSSSKFIMGVSLAVLLAAVVLLFLKTPLRSRCCARKERVISPLPDKTNVTIQRTLM